MKLQTMGQLQIKTNYALGNGGETVSNLPTVIKDQIKTSQWGHIDQIHVVINPPLLAPSSKVKNEEIMIMVPIVEIPRLIDGLGAGMVVWLDDFLLRAPHWKQPKYAPLIKTEADLKNNLHWGDLPRYKGGLWEELKPGDLKRARAKQLVKEIQDLQNS